MRNSVLVRLTDYDLLCSTGKSIVIDRQNSSALQRKPFLEAASKFRVFSIGIYLNVPRLYAQHGNIFRSLCKETCEFRENAIPTPVYNMYYKDLEAPRVRASEK
eukprot:Gregarina_sp_Poly_1__7361@NODE_4065_length_749_cov_100_601173_g2653_i0_p1_GENE_NODE_4065_length_749_cov_100_601173_g2653_i0NODE_4065_length_749_cov_100_601173_g2653_i0_p1_ORF_typecomplete_len104_score6_63AAA_33/PF13671_6/0_00042_NODE_4065_length_749_cov_100_601173_g2653_i0352663